MIGGKLRKFFRSQGGDVKIVFWEFIYDVNIELLCQLLEREEFWEFELNFM